jgi:ribosome-associated protein
MDPVRLHASIMEFAKLQFSRSGGPGGQNVNKVNSRVEIRIHIDELQGLSDAERQRLKTVLSNRITTQGELVLFVDEERSQLDNRSRAFMRLEQLILSAAKLPKTRKPTIPTRASREQRLVHKKLLSLKKSRRRFHQPEE